MDVSCNCFGFTAYSSVLLSMGRAEGLTFCSWSESDIDLSYFSFLNCARGEDEHVEKFLKQQAAVFHKTHIITSLNLRRFNIHCQYFLW